MFQLIINNIELIGEEEKDRHTLQEIKSSKAKVYGENKKIRISAGPLTAEEYKYQNYTLKATVIVYKTETKFIEK